MYEGDNPIAIQSRKWLIESLVSLMKEKPYNKITVMNICKKADLSRQTFYNVFDDKIDILRFSLKESYHRKFKQLIGYDSVNLQQIINCFEDVFKEKNEILELMIKNQLEAVISEEIAKCVVMYAEEYAPEKNDKTWDYSVSFLTGALTQVLICWFKKEERISTKELAELLNKILKGNYYKV